MKLPDCWRDSVSIMRYIYICRYKISGFPVAVESEEVAQAWVSEDPEDRVYDKIQIVESP